MATMGPVSENIDDAQSASAPVADAAISKLLLLIGYRTKQFVNELVVKEQSDTVYFRQKVSGKIVSKVKTNYPIHVNVLWYD